MYYASPYLKSKENIHKIFVRDLTLRLTILNTLIYFSDKLRKINHSDK